MRVIGHIWLTMCEESLVSRGERARQWSSSIVDIVELSSVDIRRFFSRCSICCVGEDIGDC